MNHAHAQHPFVGFCLAVVWLNDVTLQCLFQFLVATACSPAFIRHDEGAEFVTIRADANLFHDVFMTLELLFYLRGIDVLTI